MATTTLLLNGFSIVGDPQKANANASHGGEYMLKSGTSIFEDNDIVVFVVENAGVDGTLSDASEITQIIVYDNASDYYNDAPKYTYSGIADVEDGRRHMGDRYLEFEADGLTSSDPGAPTLGTLTAIAGVNIQAALASQTGPLRIDTNEDIDLNGDGIISPDEQGDGIFSSDVANGLVVICFGAGTLIETPDGLRAVENLKIGDLVNTLDSGPQKLTWVGRTTVPGTGVNTPIVIEAGALGNVRRLCVSPNHRIMLHGHEAELLFGVHEVLVPAKHLVNGTTIRSAPCPEVAYFHFLCEAHEIVFAEGCAAETLYPGKMALKSVDADAQAEILRLFPEVVEKDYGKPMARYTLTGYEARVLSHGLAA